MYHRSLIILAMLATLAISFVCASEDYLDLVCRTPCNCVTIPGSNKRIPDPTPWRRNTDVQTLMCLVNKARTESCLKPLLLDNTLSMAALRHTLDQSATGKMSHQGSDGSRFFTRINAENNGWWNGKWNLAGENVAVGYKCPNQVMLDWMASPGHRKNILGDFTNFGAGYTPNGDYWTQEFTRANVQTGSAIDCSNLFQGSNWLVDEQSVRSKFTSQGYCNAPGGTIATPSATVVIETAVPSPIIVPIQTPSPVVYITAPKKPVYDSAPAYPTAVKAPCPRSARRLSRR